MTEKEKLLLEISSTANSSYEQLKDLQLQMQSLIFQDASPERLNNIKKIVDEIEGHTLQFQKMNVELNYVQNCFIEGMMPPNLTSRDQDMITALPKYKRFRKKLSVFCEALESQLINSDLFHRRSALQSIPGARSATTHSLSARNNVEIPGAEVAALLSRERHTSVLMQTDHSVTVQVVLEDCLWCLVRYERGVLSRVVVRGPGESTMTNTASVGGGDNISVSGINVDMFSPSKMRIFRELTIEATSLISSLQRSSLASVPTATAIEAQHRALLDWLFAFAAPGAGLHTQPCCVCGRVLSKGLLPPTRREPITSVGMDNAVRRAMHETC